MKKQISSQLVRAGNQPAVSRRTAKALGQHHEQVAAVVATHDVELKAEVAITMQSLVANATLNDAAISLEMGAYRRWGPLAQGDPVAAEIISHRLIGLQTANDQALMAYERRTTWSR